MALSLARSTGGLLLLVSLSGLAQGCSNDDSDTATDDTASSVKIEDRQLVSTEVSGHDLVEGSTIRISTEDDALTVIADCNTMSAAYTYEDDKLAWSSEPASTMMACDPALMDQDAWLSELFTAGVDVSGDGSDVVLTSGDVSITLTAA
jgi:heat shock protein HslJ